jgi:GNAT superfamily N-acetyltransferase
VSADGTDAATARLIDRIGLALSDDPIGPLAMRPLQLRPVRDDDAPALTALVGAAYDEFACGPMDPTGFDADLSAPARYAAERSRRWWVVASILPPAGVTLVASVAHGPLQQDGTVELHRLYLAPPVRGIGLGRLLLDGVADEARRLGAQRLAAWSDTRLVRAHARYLSSGLRLTDRTRALDDPAGTVEVCFVLDLV